MNEPLTPREAEIVQLVAQGLSTDEIAERLTISERTIRAHIYFAMQKTHTHNRVQLTLWAQRNGLVELPTVSAQSQWRMVRDLRRMADQHEKELRGATQ